MATAGQARSQGSGSYQVDAHGPVAGGRDSAAAAVFTTGDGRCSRRASRNTCQFFSGSAFAGVVVGALPLVGFERDMEACLIAGLVLVVRVRVPSRRSIRPVVYQHFGVVQVAVAERRALFGGNAAVHITGPLLATIGYLPAAQSSAEQSRFQICPPVGSVSGVTMRSCGLATGSSSYRPWAYAGRSSTVKFTGYLDLPLSSRGP